MDTPRGAFVGWRFKAASILFLAAVLLIPDVALANGPPTPLEIGSSLLLFWRLLSGVVLVLFSFGAIMVALALRKSAPAASKRMLVLCLGGSALLLGLTRLASSTHPRVHGGYVRVNSQIATTASQQPIEVKPRTITAIVHDATDKGKDTVAHQSAVWELAEFGAPAIPALMRLLQNPDPVLRRAAAASLGNLRAEQAASFLVATLKDEDGETRARAAGALGLLNKPETASALYATLTDPNPSVRNAGAIALGRLGDSRAIQPLGEMTQMTSSYERSGVIRILGNFRTREVVEALVRALRDGDDVVRTEAAKALGESASSDAVRPLLRHARDDDGNVRNAVFMALGQIRDTRAVRPLLAAMKRSSFAGWTAARALGAIGGPAVEPLLKLSRNRNPVIRGRVAVALGLTKDTRAYPLLIQALRDQNEEVRPWAAEGLGHLGDARAAGPLLHSLSQRSPSRLELAVVEALGELRAPVSIDALGQSLTVGVPQVQQAAARALAQFDDAKAHTYLDDALRARNSRVVEAACDYFIRRGLPGSEETMIEVIARDSPGISLQGHDEIAGAFHCSGNPKLKKAAEVWAKRQNCSRAFRWSPEKSTAKWGQWKNKPDLPRPSVSE